MLFTRKFASDYIRPPYLSENAARGPPPQKPIVISMILLRFYSIAES